ncbi:cell cycle arrestin response to pheromone-related protein [Rhodotorula toruloides]|uniref:Cell cycle arrestin response to pheromone-related protein n=1 Tax=Rhodotorula toruloides TaxID=5286 RepID=A0A511KMA9_RHOTO|nr:cell cycle arrestin response to pheromone-related protein [Rhodotorula toruloides]
MSLSVPQPPSQAPQATPSTVFPALHLTPLNGTFTPKQISLDPPGSRVKIGRQTNAKTIPNGTNGYFDSKVLSRAHAEVWSEEGKVFIKDVKSSNGTFINGERLSAESTESDVYELHTDDIVEFGIDILTEDTKQVVHHKVAAKVHLVMNSEDAIASSREINNWYRSSEQLPRARPPPRTTPAQNGLSFEHVLSRLQGELQKSRDTGANLTDVKSTLGQVHDTLGGGPPPPIPPNAGVPPRPATSAAASEAHAQSIAALQAQLTETQTSLQSHVGKIRDLEGLLAEHDTIKREVGTLRAQMEEAQLSMSRMMHERDGKGAGGALKAGQTNGRESPIPKMLEAEEGDEPAHDDDDVRSVSSVDTIIAPLSRTNGISHDDDEADKSASTGPSPLSDDFDAPSDHHPADDHVKPLPLARLARAGLSSTREDSVRERHLQEQNSKLFARLDALSAELDEATTLGETLRSQHAEASSTIRALEDRIAALEKAVDSRVAEAEGRVLKEAEEKWAAWRNKFEQSWKTERETWEGERQALRKMVEEWEERKKLEADLAAAEEEDDDTSDSSASDKEDGGVDLGTAGSADADSGPSSSASKSSPGSSKSRSASSSPKKARSARRRKRPSLTPVPPSTSAPTALPRASKLSRSIGGGVASDSDSTIGEVSGRLGAEGFGWRQAGSFGGAKGVHGGEGQTQQGLPFTLAGAVVVLAVAVGYGAAMKLKE